MQLRRRIVCVALALGLVVGLAGSVVPVAAQSCGSLCDEPGEGNSDYDERGGGGGGGTDSIATIILSDPDAFREDVQVDAQEIANELRQRFRR